MKIFQSEGLDGAWRSVHEVNEVLFFEHAVILIKAFAERRIPNYEVSFLLLWDCRASFHFARNDVKNRRPCEKFFARAAYSFFLYYNLGVI
jgi:hypothetical protein